MNGVLNASVSAGSSHLEGSVTCRPHRSSPSAAGADVLDRQRRASVRTTRMNRRATVVMSATVRSVSVRNYGDPIAADPPGGWGGWGLGKPDRTVWPTARLSVAGAPVTTYDDGFPKAPPTPPALSAVLKVGSTTRVARLSCAT